jgi:hypothetical protein
MRPRFLTVSAALTAALAGATPGWAGGEGREGTLDRTASGLIFEQRQDVEEVALPQAPSGPATPTPYCTPAQPTCP